MKRILITLAALLLAPLAALFAAESSLVHATAGAFSASSILNTPATLASSVVAKQRISLGDSPLVLNTAPRWRAAW